MCQINKNQYAMALEAPIVSQLNSVLSEVA
jgi:hypothetical protein